jgi:hypothetical protein
MNLKTDCLHSLFEKPALELARKRLFKGLLARNELVVSAFAVESRSGAVTVRPFRFQIPLIKPDVRISRISAFGQST